MLFGRSREIEGLERLLESAAGGRGALRILTGEAGIGKTRLADEIAARAASRGFVVGWGRAWETGGAPPYWPWIELLQPIAETTTDPETPARLRALIDAGARASLGEGPRAEPARDRFELFDAVASYLRALARRSPLLLVFDDLHVADVASLELLSLVTRGVRGARIALLGTYRDAEARLPPVADVLGRIAREGELIALRPLSGEDVAEVVRHETGRFDGALAASLFGITEGNPLFLRETLYALTRSGDLAPRPLAELRDVALADGVTALVRGRLTGASEETRALLEAAAALGREVLLSLFVEVTERGADDALAFFADVTRRGILMRRGDDHWVFSHVLVREAFYEQIPPARRRTLHQAIARSLRARVARGHEELLVTLAHHALAALPTDDPADAVDAVRTARLAADRARGQLAFEEAIALLERALATCDAIRVDDRERAELLLALGWTLTDVGQLARARDLFRAATQLGRALGDARLLARGALGQGGEYVLAEIRSELLDVLREALAAVGDQEREDVRLRARLLARLAAALTPSRTPAEPLALAREALAMTHGETDARTRIDVDVAAGSALNDFAPPAERIAVNERLLRDVRAAGDRILELRALTRLSCDHLERGDLASAEATIAARGALAATIGQARYLWQTPLLRSMRAMAEGHFADCESAVAEARRFAVDAADPNADRAVNVHRFWLLQVAGRPNELRAQEADTLRVFATLPDGSMYRPWITAIVRAHLGDPVAAAEGLRTIGAPNVLTARMFRATTAEIAMLAGVHEWYEPLYASLLADGNDGTAALGPFGFVCTPPLARMLGALAFALGRPAEAIAHCERAVAISERMGARAHLAWIHLTWGEGLAASPADATPHLDLARSHAETLDMPEILTRASAAVTRPSARPSYPSSPAPAASGPAFGLRKDGDHWLVTHGASTFRLKEVRGLRMLARLVESPDAEIHALDLASDPTKGDDPELIDVGDSGEIIDVRARDAYKRRIEDLREEIAEADRFADHGRATRHRAELDALVEQLAAGLGLGGRERRSGSAAERARVTVQRRVREAIKKIAEQDADLGRHLDWTVRTGTFCAYEPTGRRAAR